VGKKIHNVLYSTQWACLNPVFFAKISYLEDKITKISLGGILECFGEFFGFWDIFKVYIF
jgi:hypothetical protein